VDWRCLVLIVAWVFLWALSWRGDRVTRRDAKVSTQLFDLSVACYGDRSACHAGRRFCC
jgi:hypothetical protein